MYEVWFRSASGLEPLVGRIPLVGRDLAANYDQFSPKTGQNWQEILRQKINSIARSSM